MENKGWQKDTLKEGQQVTVQGYRAKSEPFVAAARTIAPLTESPCQQRMMRMAVQKTEGKRTKGSACLKLFGWLVPPSPGPCHEQN